MALDEIKQARLDKLDKIKKAGIDPYPAHSSRTHNITSAVESFDELAESKKVVVLAGRVMAKRDHGGTTFLDINDGSAGIQFILKKDIVGEKDYDFFLETIDIGDFIEAKGTLFKTKREERTLEVSEYKILTKSLMPLPEKWHGLEDVEERLRRRYLDLIMRPEEREIFIKKSSFWQATRDFLIKEGGLEVETPVLERVPGGADAEPFTTHMNALDIDMFLRISPELNLKRLLVAGYDKVFEIGRIFRNEGIDKEHLQDYTQMEMYWAYNDYLELMAVVERLVTHVIKKTLGSLEHQWQGQIINWSGPWPRIDYYEIFKKHTGLDLSEATEASLKKYAKEQEIDTDKHAGRGRLIDVIFKKKVGPHLINPSFLILPPVDIEPLAKRYSKDTNRVERFQIVACATELAKGFSELNDPLDQRGRFEEQMKLRKAGDKEAQMLDEDFVEALEYGMPPATGFAYSERLFSVIMNRPIRETVFFPIMKPRSD